MLTPLLCWFLLAVLLFFSNSLPPCPSVAPSLISIPRDVPLEDEECTTAEDLRRLLRAMRSGAKREDEVVCCAISHATFTLDDLLSSFSVRMRSTRRLEEEGEDEKYVLAHIRLVRTWRVAISLQGQKSMSDVPFLGVYAVDIREGDLAVRIVSLEEKTLIEQVEEEREDEENRREGGEKRGDRLLVERERTIE